MNFLHLLRSFIRHLHLQRVVNPLVVWVEHRQIAKLGTYTAKAISEHDLEVAGFGKSVIVRGLSTKMMELGQAPHEKPTMTVVLSRIGRDDCVWDVGANVGFYSRLMAEVVGDGGIVVAFEPSPETFAQLIKNLPSQVTPKEVALSDVDGNAKFATPADHSSASRIVTRTSEADVHVSEVATARADTLLAENPNIQPTFVKVDVEGHEWAVLQGMKNLLSSPACRGVLVEVHFALLAAAGIPRAPQWITEHLTACGLVQQRWIGRSHLLAER